MTNQFSVGDARITLINAGDMRADLGVWLCVPPDQAPPEYAGTFARPQALPMQNIHIQLGEASVLVDASRCRFGDDSVFKLLDYAPPPPLRPQLGAAGIAPESITHVVITHAHFDHFNGLCDWPDAPGLSFPNAFHYLGRADWDGSDVQADLKNADSLIAASFGALNSAHMLMRVNGDVQVAPGISIHAAPGETPGHQIVRVHSRGESLYCLGDLYHHPVEFERPEWQVFWCEPESNARSRARVVGAALAEDARLIATHIPGLGRLAQTEAGVRWRQSAS